MDLTNDPMPDIPRLRKAVEWVEAEAARPEKDREWWQDTYRIAGELLDRSCGTCYCVAGKVCYDDGFEWTDDATADDYAAESLGLTLAESGRLFHWNNDAARVRQVAESIAARVGERL